MKTCERCGTANAPEELFCQGCGRPLKKSARAESQAMARAEAARRMENEKRRQRAGFILLGGMYALHLGLAVVCMARGGTALSLVAALLFPGLGYLRLFRPEAAFRLEHLLSIQNVENAEPSDLYVFSARIGGVLLWAAGLILLSVLAFTA